MIKSKVLRMILFLGILFTAIFFIFFFYFKYRESVLIKLGIETKQSSSSASTSVFGSLPEGTNSGPTNNPYNMAPEVVEKFKDDPAGLYFFRIGWGVDKVSASDSWDFTKSAFVAEIIDYNKDTKELKLKITLPTLMPYFGQVVTTIAKCDSEKSYVEKDNTVANPIEDLTGYFAPGSVLFTGQCADEKCSEVGSFCKVSVK